MTGRTAPDLQGITQLGSAQTKYPTDHTCKTDKNTGD